MEENRIILEQLNQNSHLFMALSDPIRIDIFILLVNSGPLSVAEITSQTDLARPTVSHHLKIMLSVGILRVSKKGVKRFYSADYSTVYSRLSGVISAINTLG